MKQCNVCKEILPLDSFGKDKPRRDGLTPDCKPCKRARQRSYYKNNKERYRDYGYNRAYNITREQYDKLLEEQDGRCAICGTDTPGGYGRLHVDHNHTTGEVRGLLCHGCNTGIGSLKDSPDTLRRAANYLEERGSYGRQRDL